MQNLEEGLDAVKDLAVCASKFKVLDIALLGFIKKLVHSLGTYKCTI